MMKNKLILLFALGLCAQVQAQVPHLSRETYRERVEAYSQVLKQQHLKSMASTDARKIAFTGFLPKVDISAEGTLNLKEMDSGTDRPDNIVITRTKAYSSCRSHSIPEVPCRPRTA